MILMPILFIHMQKTRVRLFICCLNSFVIQCYNSKGNTRAVKWSLRLTWVIKIVLDSLAFVIKVVQVIDSMNLKA